MSKDVILKEIENTTNKKVQYKKNAINEERKIFNSSSSFIEYSYIEQLEMINKLYLGFNDTTNISLSIKRELNRKISGYKHQDIKNEIYNETELINIEDVLEKLVGSKLKCLYCKCNVNIIYKCVREETQWTLDRIDNDLCHSSSNTIISCLKCNLKRRNINKEKFLFTKRLKIKKMD